MKISIITSTYKRPELLKRCIESVQNQSFKDYEHIIVQDGKDLEIKRVVESYNDPKIRYFEIEHFGNHSKPKNEGIRQSRGEYIAFLDDDVCFRADHLAILLREIESSGVDIVYGDRWMIDDSGSNFESQIGVSSDFKPGILMQTNFIDTSDVLIKREVLFTLGGWDEKYQKYLDWNLWIRADKYGYKFKHVSSIITDYHMVKGSMSMQKLDSDGMMRPAWNPHDCIIQLPYLREITEPRVAIFSLTYDRLPETTVSFGTLQNTANYPFTHIVVDNGSQDGTVDWLKGYAKDNDVQLIINADNKGISTASNQAVDWAKKKGYDIIVKVDNDAIFKTKKWLSKMVDIWKSNRKLALSCYIEGLKDNPGGAPRIVYGKICNELIGMTRHLGGIVHFVDARAYDDFRWPDDTLHGNQDVEFSMYLASKGYQMGYLENYFVGHSIDGTEGSMKRYPEYFKRRVWEKCHVYGDKYEKQLPKD